MAAVRVGLVCGHLDPARDGVADYTRQLARQLRAIGLEALVCTAEAYAPARGDDVIGVTDRWNFNGVIRAARKLARLRLDAVHVQFAPSAFGFSRAVGLLPRLAPVGLPIVVTLHEYGVWAAGGLAGPLRSEAWSVLESRHLVDRETLRLTLDAARVLVTAREHIKVLNARFPAVPHATYVPIAPNIPVAHLADAVSRSSVCESLGLPPDAVLVLFFGFLHPAKGLTHLIEAVAEVRRVCPRVGLVLCGGTESHSVPGDAAVALLSGLEDHARRHGLAPGVVFTGYLPPEQVSYLLRSADVAVFPFDAGVTAKSGSLLAAQLHGTPVIATAPPGSAPGPQELDGTLRIPPRDTAALVRALRMVLSDKPLARRLAAAGRSVAAQCSWPVTASAHAQIYSSVLDNAGLERSHRARQ